MVYYQPVNGILSCFVFQGYVFVPVEMRKTTCLPSRRSRWQGPCPGRLRRVEVARRHHMYIDVEPGSRPRSWRPRRERRTRRSLSLLTMSWSFIFKPI